MAKWYVITVDVGRKLRRIYARTVAKRDGSLLVGIGMKRVHRSCLVMTLSGTSCLINGISTYTKGFVERKNPLRISSNHLGMWLAIANDIAYQNGCTNLELFDAANVLDRYGEMQFLSKLILVRENKFVYEKYGFEAPELADRIRATVPKVKEHMARGRCLDDAFEDEGFTTKSMQMAFEKLVVEPSVVKDVVELERTRKWMDRYSDGTLDVY